jgi:putative transposase
MSENNVLQHTVWECKYHIVFLPKYRKKILYGTIKQDLGPILHELARQKGCSIEEGHIMRDHVHMLLSVPPKYSVSNVVGYIKGKSAIYIARRYRGKTRNYAGERFWARGYFVTTVGRDEEAIRNYIRTQEKEDIRTDQIPLFR